MRAALAALAAIAACGGVAPPHGPAHTPTATPETASVCPVEWKAAKTAREELLGDDSAAARARTAKVVLGQAECERTVLAGGSFTPATHAALLEQVGSLREQQRDTQNLYNEVGGYGVPLLRVASILGRGQLAAEFAARLKAIPTPSDMTEVGEQSAFRAEVATLVDYFEIEADRELRDAIAEASAAAGAEDYRDRACAGLTAIGRQRPAECGGGAGR